jgi:hypothetical protein
VPLVVEVVDQEPPRLLPLVAVEVVEKVVLAPLEQLQVVTEEVPMQVQQQPHMQDKVHQDKPQVLQVVVPNMVVAVAEVTTQLPLMDWVEVLCMVAEAVDVEPRVQLTQQLVVVQIHIPQVVVEQYQPQEPQVIH